MTTRETLALSRTSLGFRPWRVQVRRALLSGSLLGSVTLPLACSASPVGAAVRHQSTTKLLRAAYDQTVAAKTAKVTIAETVAKSSLPLQTTISGEGAVDFTSGNGEVAFTSPQAGNFSTRIVSPYVYIQLPASDSSQLPAGKTWLSINVNTVSEAKLGTSLAQLNSSSQQSTQLLSYLQSVSSSGVTTVGPATIKGAATTEYKATIDLTKAADQKNPTAQATIKALEAQLHTTMLPVQIWLDAAGRVRQIAEQLQVSTSAQSSGGATIPATSGSVSTTVDYYDFGSPVTVQPPPASQVDDVTDQALAASSTTATVG